MTYCSHGEHGGSAAQPSQRFTGPAPSGTSAQGVIHACLAQQMAIQKMQQRNAAAQDLNTWGNVQAQHQANLSQGSSTSGS